MKKLMNLLPFTTIIAGLALMTVVSSCKKDKDDDAPAVKSFRMISGNYTEDGDNYSMTVSYNSSNKLTKISESYNGMEYYRHQWTWNANVATVTEAFLDEDGSWVNRESYQKVTYLNERVNNVNIYKGDTLFATETYTWNGSKLASESMSLISADTILQAYNMNYTYDGDLLMKAELFNGGYLQLTQVIEYNNGKPVAMKNYDENNILLESSEFILTGNNITKINSFSIVEGVQGDIHCTEDRVFDANNCVTSKTNTCTGEETSIQTATFEEGTSNFNDFLLTQVSWISVYLFPDSFPSELAYKK